VSEVEAVRPSGDHGLVVHGVPGLVSREDFVRVFSEGDSYRQVDRVWTPETPTPVPPAECPLAVDAMAERVRLEERSSLVRSLLLAALVSPLVLTTRGPEARLLRVLYVALFGLPVVMAAWRWVRSRAVARTRLADVEATTNLGRLLGRRARATLALLATLVGVFVVQGDVDEAVRRAGLVKDEVAAEPWRLLTAGFLHAHEIHLAMNGLALFTLGQLVEAIANRTYLFTAFLVSVVTGSLASWWLTPIESVGASGGLMGLLGFIGAVAWVHRRELPSSLWRWFIGNVALMTAIGFLLRQYVDNAAHAGGLVGGLGVGFAFAARSSPLPLQGSRAVRAVGWASAAILAAGVVWTLLLLLRR
jgi:membrane associated rhomboid family serine protease